ncbi:MAG: DUF99 family protein [Thermoplasmatota archaeon]
MIDNPLKTEARVLGIDDGPYVRGSDRTVVVMTVYRMNGYIDGLITASVETDGSDSSEVISRELGKSRFADQIRCIVSDGACLAGFNVLDMDDTHRRTGLPVITVSDERPDTPSIRKALKDNFADWERRLEMITIHPPHSLDLPDGVCYVREKGITIDAADDTVRRCTIRGRTPEPVRISHIVAGEVHTWWRR